MKLTTKFTLVLLLIFSNVFFCNAQSQPIFEKINQSNGLSNGRVGSIIKEPNGFVWIATSNGLNRYDGNSIKIYNKQNSSLNTNGISDLFLDSKSRIWVGTLGGGLNLYNALFDRLEGERINKEFKLKFQERNEFQFKKDGEDSNSGEQTSNAMNPYGF